MSGPFGASAGRSPSVYPIPSCSTLEQEHSTTSTLTTKEATWLTCARKSCCYAAVVLPSGRDVWRIARTMQAEPWTFLVYFPAGGPRPDAFHLRAGDGAYRLALAKGPTRRTKTPPPCIFLLRTRSGAHRCGLGDLRPLACKAFPTDVINGVLCVRADTGCACRRWTLADVDLAEERPIVEARQAEYAEYVQVLARWNARVSTAAAGATFFDFCAYLLDAYDRLSGPETGDA